MKHSPWSPMRRATIRIALPACAVILAAACNSDQAGVQDASVLEEARELRELKQQEAANVVAVRKCIDLLFTQKNLARAKAECFGDVYIQHNPAAANGTDAMVANLTKMFAENPQMSFEVKRTAAEQDLVWVHSHAKFTPDSTGLAVVDIFRMKDGRVVEHWDVIQPVPATSANANSMF